MHIKGRQVYAYIGMIGHHPLQQKLQHRGVVFRKRQIGDMCQIALDEVLLVFARNGLHRAHHLNFVFKCLRNECVLVRNETYLINSKLLLYTTAICLSMQITHSPQRATLRQRR